MSPLTRQQSTQVLSYVLKTLVDDDSDKLANVMTNAGIDSIEDLVTMDYDDIYALQQVETANNITVRSELNRGTKKLILILVDYLNEMKIKLTKVDEWLTLKRDDFVVFRLNYKEYKQNPTMSRSNSGAYQNDTKLELDLFKRSIKCDATLFPMLKEDKNWDAWNRSVQALACTQDVSEVLDSNYIPEDDNNKLLFDHKQSYLYSVFNRIILTDVGKTIVRKYEDTYDAQKVYSDLVSYSKDSASANLTIENLNAQLTNLKLDSRWSGTSHGFILYWRDCMCILEDMTPVEEHYTDIQKKRMLEAAVRGVEEFRQVKVQDEQYKVVNKHSLTYLEYIDILEAAATRCDAELKLPPQRSHHNVNLASSSFNIDNALDFSNYTVNYTDTSDLVDILAEPDVDIMVNMMERMQLVPCHIWNTLSPEAQDYFKSQLKKQLSNSQQHKMSSMYVNKPATTNQARASNMHSIDGGHEDSFYDCTSNELGSMQANKSEQTHMHPGDIRNVLTTASKQGKSSMQHNSKSKKSVVVDGVTYYAN